ncbi:wax ester/triacylglycerol synthase domain-containing protein [Streptomyces mirabilis]|uniref:wax ester/triacylglycerol synthase domain-containing protein n=1 Tax=Streptomyces mirabilis TaxID=68239 RepID=UPI0036A39851
MSTSRGHRSGPVDRFFLKHRPATGFILDFEGALPDSHELAARTVRRAVGLPALNHLLPTQDEKRWRPREQRLDEAVHIRFHTGLPALEDLDAATNEVLFRPLPDGPHPPWDVRLLSGQDTGRFRLCYRIHHAIQDGVGAAYTVLALFSDTEAVGPHLHRAALPTAAGALRVLREFLLTSRHKRHWPELRAAPSRRWLWAYQDVSAVRVRSVADAYGASVNETCLAALAQAFRRWRHGNEHDGPTCPDLPALVPMSTRLAQERLAPGNRLVSHRLSLPCSAEELDEAVNRVRDRRRRSGHPGCATPPASLSHLSPPASASGRPVG